MQRFAAAVQRNDLATARELRPLLQRLLQEQDRMRLALPAGQQLRWQLRHDPEALGRLQQLCLQYTKEVEDVVQGFLHRQPRVQEFMTSKLVALYHLQERVQKAKLTDSEKAALRKEIAAVGTQDGPHVEALRKRLQSVL